jgi:hypothetical protein
VGTGISQSNGVHGLRDSRVATNPNGSNHFAPIVFGGLSPSQTGSSGYSSDVIETRRYLDSLSIVFSHKH